MKKRFRIIFMGTPEFAVPSLSKLIEEGHEIAAVVTQPDRKKGRGETVSFPPVKKVAVEKGIKTLQPAKIRKPEALEKIQDIGADLFITCAYGQILPRELLDMPAYGCINVHASLLPEYRGAAPIQRAIMNGEKTTGITTMMTDVGMDTGGILLKKEIAIDEKANAGDMHDILMHEGALLLVKTLDLLSEGDLKPVPQDDARATYAPMIKKEEGLVDWGLPCKKVHDNIRGLTPWPGSFTFYKGKRLKILSTGYRETEHKLEPGTIAETGSKMLSVACGPGILEIYRLQFENCKAMDISQCWHNIETGGVLGKEG